MITGFSQVMKQVSLDIPVNADRAIVWLDGTLFLLDQRVLPQQEYFVRCDTAADSAEAIQSMVVRGAPAIGVTAAYSVVLASRQAYAELGGNWKEGMPGSLELLASARPTAINLHWALERMKQLIEELGEEDPEAALLAEAKKIHQEDISANRKMGEWGAELITRPTSVITHCNAGALATGGYGTALGVIRSAHGMGKIKRVYADETRPWLQGSRLTAWELARDGIPVSLLVDGAAASRMAAGGIDWVIVGSDRIAANGDVANKIGTYSLALVARYHGVKVMVAAPTSTIDMAVISGQDIPIETRAEQEVLSCAGQATAAEGAKAWNPVFDVTPAALVDAIVTERGVIHSPNAEKLAKHMA